MENIINFMGKLENRIVVCIPIIIFLVGIVLYLGLAKRNFYITKIKESIKANSGNIMDDEHNQETVFFVMEKMVNNGENLCEDNLTFDYCDYCGSPQRMYLC